MFDFGDFDFDWVAEDEIALMFFRDKIEQNKNISYQEITKTSASFYYDKTKVKMVEILLNECEFNIHHYINIIIHVTNSKHLEEILDIVSQRYTFNTDKHFLLIYKTLKNIGTNSINSLEKDNMKQTFLSFFARKAKGSRNCILTLTGYLASPESRYIVLSALKEADYNFDEEKITYALALLDDKNIGKKFMDLINSS